MDLDENSYRILFVVRVKRTKEGIYTRNERQGRNQNFEKGVRQRTKPTEKKREKKTRGYGAFPPAFQR